MDQFIVIVIGDLPKKLSVSFKFSKSPYNMGHCSKFSTSHLEKSVFTHEIKVPTNDNFLGYTNVRYCCVYLVPILCHVLILGDFTKLFDILSVK